MITSKKFGFACVEISKTGTTSIARVMEKIDPEVVKLRKHTKLSELGQQPDGCFLFCFSRNPFDRVVSMYHQWKKPFNLGDPERSFLNKASALDFPAFIREIESWDPMFWGRHILQSHVCLNGMISVNCIGRFEQLQEDFDSICRHLQLGQHKLPQLNQTMRLDFRDHYDSESLEVISRHFKADLKIHQDAMECRYAVWLPGVCRIILS